MTRTPWHRGEMEVQERFGVRMPAAPTRPFMPEQHRTFFARQPVLFVGVAGNDGAPVATALTGPPGFVASPDPETLVIATQPPADDPADAALHPGTGVGLLGLEFATRRRNRANGVVLAREGTGVTVAVQQSFGNCPQYIHPRWPAGPTVARKAERLRELDAAATALITQADTVFVASASGPGIANGGTDISHRGGPPGFVQVAGNRLTIPDYRGNRFFNTLGNLLLDPRAALLFVDWPTGGLLHLQGRATIAWAEWGAATWSVEVSEACRRPGALGLGWRHQAPTPERGA